jgi:hypothetical protein
VVRDEHQIKQMNLKLDQLVSLAQKTYQKEDRSIERVIDLLHKDFRSRKP